MRVNVPAGSMVIVMADAPFSVFEVVGDERRYIGPRRSSDRRFRVMYLLSGELDVVCTGHAQVEVVGLPSRREVVDDRPVEVPLRFRRGESDDERIRRLIRQAVSQQAELSGGESFDESNDFEVGEDIEPVSPYEYNEMPLEEFDYGEEERSDGAGVGSVVPGSVEKPAGSETGAVDPPGAPAGGGGSPGAGKGGKPGAVTPS